MIGFMKACEIAKKKMINNGYLPGFVEIRENDSMWFFSGRMTKGNKTEYGNIPFSVDKNTGECNPFLMFAPGHIIKYLDTEPVTIPEEYKK